MNISDAGLRESEMDSALSSIQMAQNVPDFGSIMPSMARYFRPIVFILF